MSWPRSQAVFVLEAQYLSPGAACGDHPPTARYLFFTRQEADAALLDLSRQQGLCSVRLLPSQLTVGEEGDAWFFEDGKFMAATAPASRAVPL